ncbi:MAG TPA: cytochrome-c oxidase [Gammaproteobacteria bacterium]|jgi:cytochrome c oxidase subunit 3
MMTALAIALLLGVTVWWLLVQRLRDKPWTVHGVIPGSQEGLTSSAPKVGLWVFLGMVTSLFLIFAGAYVMRMDHGHSPLQEWQPVSEPSVLWINTVALVVASILMQIAHSRVARSDLEGTRRYFSAAGILTVVFLLGQLLAWRQLAAQGNYDHRNPAYSFFILLTAAHGLHLVGGLWVLGRTAARLWRGLNAASIVQVAAVRQSVALCTIYWHFLLLVWLGLFVLLMST